jgi:glutamine synthetase
LADAVAAFEADAELTSAFGEELATTLMDVRRGEIARLGSLPPNELCARMRYLH